MSVFRFFISYRYCFSYSQAFQLKRLLEDAFENIHVFRDEDEVQAGDSFKDKILPELQKADCVLALLHRNWLHEPKILGEDLNKLHSEDCWVRRELVEAASKEVPIVPICLYGAKMPTERSAKKLLPEELHFLHGDTLALFVYENNQRAGWNNIISVLEIKFKDRLQRKPSSSHLINILRESGLEEIFPLPSRVDHPAPYMGITHFQAVQAGLFFGREQSIVNLWKDLDRGERRVMFLYGYSGVGKSSLLEAGLFPRIEKKGWKVLHARYDKNRSLADLLREKVAEIGPGKHLVSLDQIEGAILAPYDEHDLTDFMELIKAQLNQNQNFRILLGFRKEYLAEVEKAWGDMTLIKKHPLEPLDLVGMRQAIVLDDAVLEHYEFVFEPGLPEEILKKMDESDVPAHNASVKTPWLQIVLMALWEKAKAENTIDPLGKRILKKEHFKQVWKKSFPEQISAQINELKGFPAPHPEYLENGLTLELLNALTTPSSTAAEMDRKKFSDDFSEPHLQEHLDHLIDLRLVVDFQTHWDQPHHLRLTHDALAPVIRTMYENSDAPVQRANRIFASKAERNSEGRVTGYRTIDNEYDLEELKKAKRFMRKWTEEQDWVLAKGQVARKKKADRLRELIKARTLKSQLTPEQEKELEERARLLAEEERAERENRERIFNNSLDIGLGHLEGCKHTEALRYLRQALEVGVSEELKKVKLYAAFEELFYFFVEAEQFTEEARQAAEALLELAPEADLQKSLAQWVAAPGPPARAKSAPLMQALQTYALLQARYYTTMVRVEGGEFTMGDGLYDNNPRHQVRVDGFEIGETPVTFYQYALYCAATKSDVGASAPSWGIFGDNPVVNVSWYEVLDYCNWYSQREGHTACYTIDRTRNSDPNNNTADYFKWKVNWEAKAPGYRLPTEAEWEYAARGGRLKENFRYAGSDQLEDVGWYWLNSGKEQVPDEGQKLDMSFVQLNDCRTRSVKGLKPNGLDLYDMSGNVCDWCWDWFDAGYYRRETGIVENPRGAEFSSIGRVVRGGSWGEVAIVSQAAYRNCYSPVSRYRSVGFRLLRALPS